MKFNNSPTEQSCILINESDLLELLQCKQRNNRGLGFCNAHAYKNILIIINTMHCLDIHRQNTIIHHWLQEEMLTTKGDLGFFHFRYISEFAQIHVSKQKQSSLKQFSLEGCTY